MYYQGAPLLLHTGQDNAHEAINIPRDRAQLIADQVYDTAQALQERGEVVNFITIFNGTDVDLNNERELVMAAMMAATYTVLAIGSQALEHDPA